MDGQAQRKLEIAPNKSTSSDPCNKTTRETKLSQSAVGEGRKFEVCCNAGSAGHLEVASDSLSVRIGQRISGDSKDGLWGSLLVECKEQDDGSLAVDVVVFHPDWDEPLRIASIQSNPSNGSPEQSSLRFDFKQKQL
jgi:hypothetical protein